MCNIIDCERRLKQTHYNFCIVKHTGVYRVSFESIELHLIMYVTAIIFFVNYNLLVRPLH